MDKKIKKCIKSYLTAKKYLETNGDMSYEYFKQCLNILNDLKTNPEYEKNNYADIMNETETECAKFITKNIETNIEKPILIEYKSTDDELFELIQTGNITKLKSFQYGQVNFEVLNTQGLTPLHVAISFGDMTFLKHAFKLGAGIDLTNKYGHTLLEYACLERDPNLINFLTCFGANMRKHLLFREGQKYFNFASQIDIAILEKLIMDSNELQTKSGELKYLNDYKQLFGEEMIIDIGYIDSENSTVCKETITVNKFLLKLDGYLHSLSEESRNTYLEIIKEELQYPFVGDKTIKLGCPNNKIEILLYYLVPFMNYKENLQINWLISLEIKFLILKILKNKVKINAIEMKDELNQALLEKYIKPEIFSEGLIQTLVQQWISKIKV
jgi:hypothetical protein